MKPVQPVTRDFRALASCDLEWQLVVTEVTTGR